MLRHVARGSAASAEACAEAGAATVIVAAIRAHPDQGLQAACHNDGPHPSSDPNPYPSPGPTANPTPSPNPNLSPNPNRNPNRNPNLNPSPSPSPNPNPRQRGVLHCLPLRRAAPRAPR